MYAYNLIWSKKITFIFSVPIILVGNKTDLQSDRRVSQEQGKRLAEEMKAVFIETSAKENQVCFLYYLYHSALRGYSEDIHFILQI